MSNEMPRAERFRIAWIRNQQKTRPRVLEEIATFVDVPEMTLIPAAECIENEKRISVLSSVSDQVAVNDLTRAGVETAVKQILSASSLPRRVYVLLQHSLPAFQFEVPSDAVTPTRVLALLDLDGDDIWVIDPRGALGFWVSKYGGIFDGVLRYEVTCWGPLGELLQAVLPDLERLPE